MAQKLGRDIDDKFTHIFKNVTQVVIRSRMQNVKFTVCLDLPCELARLFPDRPRNKTSPDKESHGAGHLLLPTTHGMQKFILKVNKNKIFCSQMLELRYQVIIAGSDSSQHQQIFPELAKSSHRGPTFTPLPDARGRTVTRPSGQ